jgi:hypothetical protein
MDGERPLYLVPQLLLLVAQPLAMGLGALAQKCRQYLGTAPRLAPLGAALRDGARQLEDKVRHKPILKQRLFRSLFQIWLPVAAGVLLPAKPLVP